MDQVHTHVAELVQTEVSNPRAECEQGVVMALTEHIRKGNANVVLDAIRPHFKYDPPEVQVRMMTLLDQCLSHSTPQFACMLSSEKWTERFFKVAKTSPSDEVRVKVLTTCLGWYKRYNTSGHQRLMQRFQQSKTLGGPFKHLLHQNGGESRVSHSARRTGAPMQTFDNVADPNPNQVLNQEETVLLQCQGDLASLEYALEHPHILEGSDIANECKKHKEKCMRMLESCQHERIAPELMSLIEQFSNTLELYEAMTGIDIGEGLAARQRALENDDLAEPDSDDDEHQKRLRMRAAPRTDVGQAMLQAQQQTQDVMNLERAESDRLRDQLNALRREHEKLENKYKDAKSKNKEALVNLEIYATRAEQYEKGMTANNVMIDPLLGVGRRHADPSSTHLSLKNLTRMRDSAQVIRLGLQQLRDECPTITRDCKMFSAQITSALAAIAQASQNDRQADQKALRWTQELYKKEMKLRKQYYNTIQELKGNIRVYCRVRPMLPMETNGGHRDVAKFPSSDELALEDANGRIKHFEFDEVYPPTAPQAKVFEDTSPLIDSVVDGYNVCIFAYGQTGSGKTFTMGGGEGESQGINARALQRLFQIIDERKETDESTVVISVLEIYCEQIRDLLVSKKESAGVSYDVKQGGPYGTYVTNLSEVVVKSPGEINSIMMKAQRNRSEGTTNMNEHSSRSHMLLYIIVRTKNKQTNMQSYGKLSLIDLAGSERLDKSGAEGQQLKEAVSINKSLSALGDVISGLSQSNKHIPFRNSALTFLLQDSMAGQAKVLMFVCVSPASYNVSESMSSLQFASRARGVEFGQIKKNAAKAE